MPRILATILNETIVAGMIVLLHRCRTARFVPAAHLHISYAKVIFGAGPSFTAQLFRRSGFPDRERSGFLALGDTSQEKADGCQMVGRRLPILQRGPIGGKASPGRFSERIVHGSSRNLISDGRSAPPRQQVQPILGKIVRTCRRRICLRR